MLDAANLLDSGRAAYTERSWAEAHALLSEADRGEALGSPDLDLLAVCAYMIGREDEYLALLERNHDARLAAGDLIGAWRCAFWLGVGLARRGDVGAAGGWLGRAQRMLDGEAENPVERAYMRLPVCFERQARGDWESAARLAEEATASAARHGDADLLALAGHEQGHILIRLGRTREGLALLDEAMLAADRGALSPIVTGIVYCGVIIACREAHEVVRAREWTAALSSWCDGQPEMVAFTGRCRIHRAEILQLEGAWGDALIEAERGVERSLQAQNPAAAGEASYRSGELHRLRGDLEEAERAFSAASSHGYEPQPGLALLRVAQGRTQAAAQTIGRLLKEVEGSAPRAAVMPAYVEIMLALGNLQAAREGCEELEALAEAFGSAALLAQSAFARGSLLLAANDPQAALPRLRRAARAWVDLGAPYEAARARELIGLACRALDDREAAAFEIGAARETFDRLGAQADARRAGAWVAEADDANRHGLTAREIEVLQRVAAGERNREIADALVISEHTVARHMQNIYAKLGVSSRTAAAAFAFAHGLA